MEKLKTIQSKRQINQTIMKRNLFVLACFAFVASIYGQNQSVGNLRYYITTNDQDKLRLGKDPSKIVHICNTVRGIVKLGSDGVATFDVFSYVSDDPATINYNNGKALDKQCLGTATIIDTAANAKPAFIINLPKRGTLGASTPYTYLKYTSWNFGVSTIGVRFRGEDNNGKNAVGASVNAAFNGGFTRGFVQISPRKLTHYYLNFGAFAGVASTELNSATVSDANAWGTAKQTNPTVMYGPCLIIGRNNLGLVLTYGWENALGSDHQRWIFNDKPWFGIGIASSLGFY
jgi:hypothetical protein